MPILGILDSSKSKGYSLLATFTSGGNFIVPNGISRIAVFLVGPGGAGSNGTNGPGAGGAGGAGSPGIAFKDYPVSSGLVFPVSVGVPVGGKGGQPSPSTFRTFISTIASSGYATGQNTFVAGSCTVPGHVSSSGAVGGNGGAARSSVGAGNAGSAGGAAGSLTLNLDGLGDVTINSGAGGPGGGGGAFAAGSGPITYAGGSPASSGGSISGTGGVARAMPPIAADATSPIYAAYLYGSGGPGGGGGGYSNGDVGLGTSGLPGRDGVVYIYGY